MTEAEWFEANDPKPLLDFSIRRCSDRKLRLLAVACCLELGLSSGDAPSRNAVSVAEQFAEGTVDSLELVRANLTIRGHRRAIAEQRTLVTAQTILDRSATGCLEMATELDAGDAARGAVANYVRVVSDLDAPGRFNARPPASLLRDIIGNPFRPITVDPAWRTSTVVSLAQGIYDERAFDRLPILADALEDAGCTNEEILNHCRQPGEHVRGCWCVDLLLDKK